jgi:hypothetical protein
MPGRLLEPLFGRIACASPQPVRRQKTANP